MTAAEFKAWLEGFSSALDGVPNEDQWRLILERAKSITDTPTMMPTIIREKEYVPRPWYPTWITTTPGRFETPSWGNGTITCNANEVGRLEATANN